MGGGEAGMQPLRLVVVSPSDVKVERDIVPDVVNELNSAVCGERDLCIVAYRWENQAYTAFHTRGYQQGVIDRILKIDEADVVIAIFWTRLGTPDPKLDGKTGSEYELDQALARLNARGPLGKTSPHIAVYRSTARANSNWRDAAASQQKDELDVYLRRIERPVGPDDRARGESQADSPSGFVADYDGPTEFRHRLYADLHNWVRTHFAIPDGYARTFGGEELLAAYHRSLEVEHARVPGLFREYVTELDTVFIELDIETERSLPVRRGVGRTLRQLMEEPAPSIQLASRWVVLGHPGSGKSTLARHLVWELASEHVKRPNKSVPCSSPVPVYASLPALMASEGLHPFDRAERVLRSSNGETRGRGLFEILAARARHRGGVWLLLDGLDEVPMVHSEALEDCLALLREVHRVSDARATPGRVGPCRLFPTLSFHSVGGADSTISM